MIRVIYVAIVGPQGWHCLLCIIFAPGSGGAAEGGWVEGVGGPRGGGGLFCGQQHSCLDTLFKILNFSHLMLPAYSVKWEF